jgi:hypothetical protein
MTDIFQQIKDLVQEGSIRISEHGYDELSADTIYARDVASSITTGVVVEEYPDYSKGPCVLVLQKDRNGNPLHVVWGIPKGHSEPAVVVTAYRPSSDRWEKDFIRRRK